MFSSPHSSILQQSAVKFFDRRQHESGQNEFRRLYTVLFMSRARQLPTAGGGVLEVLGLEPGLNQVPVCGARTAPTGDDALIWDIIEALGESPDVALRGSGEVHPWQTGELDGWDAVALDGERQS